MPATTGSTGAGVEGWSESGPAAEVAAPASFGALLRRHRLATGLTQEALAERAGLSPRAIQSLERGIRRPYRETAGRLARALALEEADRVVFEVAALPAPRRPAGGRPGPPARPALPNNLPLPATPLVGREDELIRIRRLLEGEPAAPEGGPESGAGQPRLLTLTGPGGSGKTRLALEVARTLAAPPAGPAARPPAGPGQGSGERFRDGVWLVELAALTDGALVPQTVAAALGVREEPGRPPEAGLAAALQPKRLLLVLDNCEHLIEAGADLVARLLATCPGVRVLATSREPLRLAGEQQWRVPPLEVPDPDRPDGPDELAGCGAVRLFVARAQAAAPGFRLTAANAGAVAHICRRLDGLPLALELAAARIQLLPPAALRARLERRLPLPGGGPRDAPARHQTLRAAVAWSYELLTPAEQACFRRLAVCAGGWTLETAAAVCDLVPAQTGGAGADPPLPDQLRPEWYSAGTAGGDGSPLVPPGAADGLLEAIDGLVAKSLVGLEEGPDAEPADREPADREPADREPADREPADREPADREPAPGWPRYRMLETLREYALERLQQSGEAEATRGRHAAHFLALAGEAEVASHGPRQVAWLSRLEQEHDNLRAALAWCGQADPATGLALASHLAPFWEMRAHHTEGRRWLAALLAAPAAPAAPAGPDQASAGAGRAGQSVRGRAMLAACALALAQRDLAAVADLAAAGLASLQEAGDRAGMGWGHCAVGRALMEQGDYAAARPLLEAGLAGFEEIGDRRGTAAALAALGDLAKDRGDIVRAGALYAEALARFRALGDKWELSRILCSLAGISRADGDYERASRLLTEALSLFRELGDQEGTRRALIDLGNLARLQGDYAQARALLAEGLDLARRRGGGRPVALSLQRLGHVAAAERDDARAWHLYEESLALFRRERDQATAGVVLGDMGNLARDREEYDRARTLWAASAAIARGRTGFAWLMGWTLGNVGALLAQAGDPAAGLRLLAAAQEADPRFPDSIDPDERAVCAAAQAAACAALGAAAAAARDAGRALTPAAALVAALEALAPGRPARSEGIVPGPPAPDPG